MTRLVAGVAGGRRLAVPAGRTTRPTGLRAREGLFSRLGDLGGATVLDLFAGTGAVGLEALSRGARAAVLVEANPKALRVLRANVAAVGLPGALVLAAPVARVLARPPGRRGPADRFDVVFCDPPWADPLEPVLAALVAGDWIAADAVVVASRSIRDSAPDWPAPLVGEDSRRYGDTRLWYGRLWYGR